MKTLHYKLMYSVILGITILAAPYTSNADTSILQETGKAFSEVAAKATPAVVFIKVEKRIVPAGADRQQYYHNNPFDIFGDDFFRRYFGNGQGRRFSPHSYRQRAAGSGFLISEDGYILTNNHVVGDADKITVTLNDGREFSGTLVGTDPKSEVAVIKIDDKNLPYLELGDSKALNVGEWVIAIGSPFEFFTGSVTVGVVSAKGRSNLNLMQDVEYQDFIQTDAAINPGNSGGPLLGIDGKVVGINTAIVSSSGGFQGLGFAIPINMAKAIKNQLIATGKVVRGYLGINIQEITPDLAEAFGLKDSKGILIAEVIKNSAAEKAGLKAEDIITKLNGKEIESVQAFKNAIASNPPGAKVSLRIKRNGKEKSIDAETGSIEDLTVKSSPIFEKLGITVEDLTAQLAARFGYELNEGVIISSIDRDSPVADAFIEPGHLIKAVNRRRVRNVEEFKSALELSAESGTVLLLIKSERHSYYVTISLDD